VKGNSPEDTMTRLASKLALAAVLTATLPAAALAQPCDDDRRSPVQALPVAHRPPAPPPMPAGWEREGWRERELREIRSDLRALEAKRAAFHQRWGWHARKVARFERSYALERAELERRREALMYYAWR
jgi:hypothetical protein